MRRRGWPFINRRWAAASLCIPWTAGFQLEASCHRRDKAVTTVADKKAHTKQAAFSGSMLDVRSIVVINSPLRVDYPAGHRLYCMARVVEN